MLVVFNFKNQMSIHQQMTLLEQFNQPISKEHQLIVAPIVPVQNKDYCFEIAVQNLSIKRRMVGDLSPHHLEHFNIQHAFIGHLERQHFLNEEPQTISSKVDNALHGDIIPIICLGSQEDVVLECASYLEGLDLQNKQIIFAYEILSATLKGKRDYFFDEVDKTFQKLKDYLDTSSYKTGFSYQLIFGGGVHCDDIKKILTIGFDGVLIGDRVETLSEVYQYLQMKIVLE